MKTTTVLKPPDPPADDIAAAEGDLREALLAGAPTAPHRARIAELHAAVARAAAERAAAEARGEAAEASAVCAMAAFVAAQAGARLAARSAEPLPLSRPENHMDHPLIVAPAQNVASATRRATAADAALIGAAESEMKIVARIEDLRGRHAAIVARRLRGERGPDDGGDLALLAADTEGLVPLLSDAQAVTAAARRQVETARGQLDLARQALVSVEMALELDALLAHTRALDGAMVGALGRLGELLGALGRGGTPPYCPSVELALGVRKLLAAAGRL